MCNYIFQPAKIHFFIDCNKFYLKKDKKKSVFTAFFFIFRQSVPLFYSVSTHFLLPLRLKSNIVFTLRLNNHLRSYSTMIWAVVNCTPDSFYSGSRLLSEQDIQRCIDAYVAAGADCLDIGGCSTRPGAGFVSEAEEWDRIEPALSYAYHTYPQLPLSVDTFRVSVAQKAVRQYEASIINDVSGGALDEQMFSTIARLQCAYVLTHSLPQNSDLHAPVKTNNLLAEIMHFFAEKTDQLQQLGVKDIILDPGFGFGKTTEDNFLLLKNISLLQLFNRPVLAGLSRKSMLQQAAQCSAQEALPATIAANTIALINQAQILRVHDVTETKQILEIVQKSK